MPLSARDRELTCLVTTFLPPPIACYKGTATVVVFLLAGGVILWRHRIKIKLTLEASNGSVLLYTLLQGA